MTLHNPNKVLMGTTGSNVKEVTNHVGDIPAGKLVHLKSDGTISITKSDGTVVGISLGKDLSGTDHWTAVCRKGLRVPMQLTAGFDPTVGAVVSVSDTTGLAVTSGGTAYNATYSSGRIGGTGVNGGQQEDGTTVGVAYIDFPGGL